MTAPSNQTQLLHLLGTECLTIAEIGERLGLTTDQVGDAARLLIRRSYVERVARGCFQLTDEGRSAAASGTVITSGPANIKVRKIAGRHRPSLQQRAWNIMRLRRRFTVSELVMCAGRSDDAGPDDTVQRYLRALARAGYARVVDTRPEGRKGAICKVYSLARDTGQMAPSVIHRGTTLYDHNTATEVAL